MSADGDFARATFAATEVLAETLNKVVVTCGEDGSYLDDEDLDEVQRAISAFQRKVQRAQEARIEVLFGSIEDYEEE